MAVAGSVDGLTRHCTTQLAEARRRLDAIAALDAGEPAGVAWSDTFGRFDEVRLALRLLTGVGPIVEPASIGTAVRR